MPWNNKILGVFYFKIKMYHSQRNMINCYFNITTEILY